MKFSVQASVNKRLWKILNFFDFFVDDVIHDVIDLMNLGNEYKITDFITVSKSYAFIIT